MLLYNVKDTATFYSDHWNTGTNPDLAFVGLGPYSLLLDRHVFEKFSRSQHQPLLITPPRFAMAVPSMPIKQWNFYKAKWSHHIALTIKFTKVLLPPDLLEIDAANQECSQKDHSMQSSEQLYFVLGCRVWIPSHNIFSVSSGSDSSLAAAALRAELDRKQRDWWFKAVWSIDFSHSSCNALSTLNNLTHWFLHFPHQCPILANAISSQLIRNEKYAAVNHNSSQLVLRSMWPLKGHNTKPSDISETFSRVLTLLILLF